MSNMCFVTDNCFHEDHAVYVKNVKYLRGRMCQVDSYCYIPLLDCHVERTRMYFITFYVGPNILRASIILLLWRELFHVHQCDAFISLRIVQRLIADHHRKYWWFQSCSLLKTFDIFSHLYLCSQGLCELLTRVYHFLHLLGTLISTRSLLRSLYTLLSDCYVHWVYFPLCLADFAFY